MKNPVARHINTFNKPSVITSKRCSLQSEATLRDAREDALNELECSHSLCFDEDLQGCMNCVGCSNLEIDCEED